MNRDAKRHPLFDRIGRILLTVTQPGRYAGGEWNTVLKDLRSLGLHIGLACPVLYEEGMGNPELAGLYGLLNRKPEVGAERVFLPDRDMESALARAGLPLFSLESRTPLGELDVIHFCLGSALHAVNLPAMLEMAGIPPLAVNRRETDPLILAGGPLALTPEPLADFVDIFLVGETDDVILAFSDTWQEFRAAGLGRVEIVLELARTLEGAYAPGFYRPEHDAGGRLRGLIPTEPGLPVHIRAARIRDLDTVVIPAAPVVAGIRTAGDSVYLEVTRGSPPDSGAWDPTPRKGSDLPPVRSRSLDELVISLEALFLATGHEEIVLLGRHPALHPRLEELLAAIRARFKDMGMLVTVPGLSFRDQVETLAPINEAMSWNGIAGMKFHLHSAESSRRLGRLMSKEADQDELPALTRRAFASGARSLKIRAVVGVPGETDEDLRQLGFLARRLEEARRDGNGRRGRIEMHCYAWIPRPHSPLEREAFNCIEDLEQKIILVRKGLGRKHGVRIRWKSPSLSLAECLLTRGDRRLSTPLLELARAGYRVPSLEPYPPDPDALLSRFLPVADADRLFNPDLDVGVVLPWDHVTTRNYPHSHPAPH